MKIEYLLDHTEYVPILASWFFEEWGHLRPEDTLQDYVESVREHLNRDEMPLCLIALDGTTVLGSASLRRYDMSTRRDLSPWMGSVYVSAEHRRLGVGAELVAAVEEKALKLGFDTLYLWTPDKEDFYARRGWSVLDRTEYLHEQAVVMHKKLSS